MQANCKDVVTEVFVSVMEKTAFMFGEPAEKEDLPLSGQAFVQATMSFSGPLRGQLVMAVPKDSCVEIAANVLGMDAEEGFVAERAMDSLKEILNVTCGHILTAMAGEEPVFDLSIPEVQDADEASVKALARDERTLGFVADDCLVLLRLTMDVGAT